MRTIFRRFSVGGALAAVLLAAPLAFATPTISFTPGQFPATGSPVALAQTPAGLNISVTAAPTAGATISSVVVAVNGTAIGTATGASPFVVNWVPTTAGSFTISATVNDTSTITTGASASTNTATINQIVSITAARAVTVAAPANNAAFAANSQTFLRASASMTDGVVSKVDFILDPGTANTIIGTATQAPYNVPYTVTASVGAHTLLARATAADGTTTVDSTTLNFTVSSAVGTAPTVAITSPTAGAFVATSVATTITATASDADGFIPSTTGGGVTFYVDGDPIGTDLTAPYSVSWTPTTAKSYSLRALAVDDKGNTTLSSAVTVTATASLPTVSITAPANNSSATVGIAQNITASATPSTGATVTQVAFLANGVAITGSPITTSPYTLSWTPAAAGSVALTAQVTDSAGITATSAAVNVNVIAPAPTVSITAPSNGSSTTVGTATTVSANATASSGANITQVEFFANGVSIAVDTALPYSVVWTPASAGVFSLTAVATQTGNVTATSAAVSVTVNGVTPTAAITSPAAGASLVANTATTITAAVTPSTGATVTQVVFLANGTQIGTDTTAPYSFDWTPTTTGAFSLTIRVVDSTGASQTSAAVAVTVVAAQPTVTLTAPAGGAIINNGSTVNLTATAAPGASGAAITQVQFFAGTTLLGTATSSPYTAAWVPTTNGNYALTAKATDANGGVATSAVVNVAVATSTAPTVTLTAPVNGASVILGSNVSVTAGASAVSPATVARVEFYADGVIFNVRFASPYTITYQPSTLGFVTLTAKVVDSAGNSTTSSPVTISVTQSNPAAVTLAAVPSTLTVPVGSTRILNATATSDGIVTKVEYYMDGTLFDTDTTAPFSVVFIAPNQVGTHLLTARMYDSLGQTATSANLVINITAPVGTPPVAGITAPASGSFQAAGTSITISGNATDADGTVTTVQVLANGVSLGNATLASTGAWSIGWTPSAVGAVSLVAIATDDRGNSTVTPAVSVNITDTTAPVITLGISPGSTTLPTGATRNLLATATASAGRAIVRVEFFVNGTKVGEKTSAPYGFRYTAPTVTGTYVVSARATDNTGLARDALATFIVIPAVGAPPTISLLTPTNNTSITLANPTPALNLAASALAAAGGTIASVQFYQNGTPIGGGIAPPSTFTTTFTPTAPGSYVFDAIATDDRGNTTVSNASTVTAAFGTPTVAITSPNPNATTRVTPNVPVTISAAAQGGSGAAVLLVEFLLDGVQIGTRTIGISTGLNTIYSFSWTPTTAQLGPHVLTARVTDTNSQTATTTQAANINVATITGTPPTITITSPVGAAATSIQSLSTVNFIANAFASGTNNNITSVEFFLNDASIGTAAREQATNLYRLAYNFSAYDFSAVTPDINGRYPLTLYAIAKDTNGNQTLSTTINLAINVAQSLAPSVTLQTIPGFPTTVQQNTAFLMVATPIDPDGFVTTLQLFANGSLAPGGTISNPSSSGTLVTYTPTAAGRYNLFVVATDDTGNTAISTPAIILNVTAINPPTTDITRPSDNSTVTTVNSPVFLEGTASGSDITQTPIVQFVVTASTGARAATITAARVSASSNVYRAIWTPTTPDTYTIATQASVGTVSANSTASRRVVVNNVVGIGPSVSSISFNPNQTSFTSASTANFNVTATDADGAISSVEYFLNRNSIGMATRDQLTNTWRLTTSFAGIQLGTYELVAIARDSAGNVAASPTTNIAITNATSAPPSVSIVATPSTVAFSQAAQLTALASDPDGNVNSVQYFVNGASVGTSFNASSNYQINWTSSTSGTFNVYGLATDNTGNTAISSTLQVIVKRNNPVLDNDAYVLQTFQDIVARSPNSSELTLYGGLISSGAMSRADLVNTLVQTTATNTTFTQVVNALATYYVIMGQWPTTANYSTIYNLRGSTSNVAGNVISSADYILRYPERTTPTVALLNDPNSAIPADKFLLRLWQNAGLPGTPEALDSLRFRNNNTANLALGIGRGYNAVGLNTAIAEFVTNTNVNNIALFNSARAAALFFMLAKPQVLTDTTNALAGSMTVPQLTARIASLVPLLQPNDVTAVADACIKDTLYAYRYVTITKQPQSLVVLARSAAIFSVEASGQPPITYQWLLNGAPIVGATNATLTVTGVDGTKTGTYSVAVSTPAGSATSDPATLQLTTTPTRVANLSTRGVTNAGGQLLIGGFVVSGPASQTRQMLIRVVGPTLAAAGVAGVLADPRLEVYSAANPNTPVLTNDNWGTQTGGAAAVTALQQAATRVGAFALPNNSRDAAVLATLNPGLYTVQAKAPPGDANPGVVLIEVYDATANVTLNTPKPVNVSTRGPVGTGANIMIAGFVINGAASRRVLIRGAGPTLARFNVPAVLADPQIELFDSAGVSLRKNDDWAAGDDAAQIAAASTAAGAFPLANGSKDSAMLLMLAPGAYTVHLSGVNSGTGIGLVEVYDVDP